MFIRDAISLFYLHRLIYHVCVEWCTPVVNRCVDCALFNAVLNVVYLKDMTNATSKISQQCYKDIGVMRKKKQISK